MAADPWKFYDSFIDEMGRKVHDFTSHTFKVALFASTSNCDDDTKAAYADLTDELATANGYTAGGQAVTVTWSETGGIGTFTFADAAWTATGGSIAARWAVMRNASVAGEPLVARALLDNAPADLVATDGQPFTVGVPAPGDPMFTVEEAAA